MASTESAASRGRGKHQVNLETKDSLRRNKATRIANDTSAMPQRSVLHRQSTPEMEMIEKGSEENVSIFDVLVPSARESSLSFEERSGVLDSDSDTEDFDDTESDVDKYMARREMTPLQERMNAITVIPGAFYCFLFLLSGAWLDKARIDEIVDSNDLIVDESMCLSSSWFPHLHALPPLPVVAASFGIICHAPFSFIYHWSYAHRLSRYARTNHWSRRMDQAMIHFCSASMSYATSGRWDFFFANLLFNADCFYRQFKKQVRPKRNQIRIAISVIAYTIPILRRGDWELFAQLWAILSISFILFAFYPIGGWSHSVFHLVMVFVPPLLMDAAIDLPASQERLKLAAQCAAMAKQSMES